MSHATRLFLGTVLALATALSPRAAHAAEPKSATCSVQVDYLVNGVNRSTYTNQFTVAPGVNFSDDFSSVTRFRFFGASATLSGDRKSLSIVLSYYNDVGVFETVDFSTTLVVRDDRLPQTAATTHTYFSSLGAAGNHTTQYAFTCQVDKN